MRHRLTDEQICAATSTAVRTFIEAGPGTGKTTIAAERFGHVRFREPLTSPRGVVAVSFTVAATSEMRQRIVDRWGPGVIAGRSRVRTIDNELSRILGYLLRSNHIQWPGGLTAIEPLDSCDRHPAWTYSNDPRHFTWQPELVEDQIRPVKVKAKHRRITKAGMVDLLERGVCTHDDVRRILASAMQNSELRTTLKNYRRATVAHFIVDEVFDADAVDLELIRLHCEAGVPTTVAGDHWQALYEFRNAVPSDVAGLVGAHAGPHRFHHVPVTKSHRFCNGELAALASNLRGGSCTVPVDDGVLPVQVVIGRWWKHLWAGPAWVLPLSFGSRISNKTDALFALLLDHIAYEQFGERGRYQAEALMELEATEEDLLKWEPEFANVCTMLTDATDEVAASALNELRRCRSSTSTGATVPRFRNHEKEKTSSDRMRMIAERLLSDRNLVRGISAHQAKGQEWKAVGVCIPDDDVAAIASGLNIENKDHRALYVALTRGTHRTVRV